MKIIILHQAIPPNASADERDVLDQARAVGEGLRAAGHAVELLPVSLDLGAVRDALQAARPDLAFNLVESIGGADRLLPTLPALLEILKIPYTGNSADALLVTTHKLLAKQRLRQAGLPTPDWIESTECTDTRSADETPAEWILKSVWDHASAGMSGDNLLRGTSRYAAVQRLAALVAEKQTAWFAERYIEGREFNVSLYERGDGTPEILPPAEILFIDFPPGKPRILDYEAKWNTASFAYAHTPRTFDLPAADAALTDRLRALCQACWKVFGLTGYARVDFRIDAAGQPWILEVNANPCLAPDAGFAAALQRAGIPFSDALLAIVAAARATPGGSVPPGVAPEPVAGLRECAPTPPHPPETRLAFREKVDPGDAQKVRELVAATGYFHADEVAVAEELVTERLRLGEPSGYCFLFAEDDSGKLAGYSCFGPTPCTASSYDLYWIAVAPDHQKCGLGRELSRRTEAIIATRGGTRLYAETSNRPQYASTRAFYERTGYTLASLLDDFYAPGDGKATYLKVLG